jgi:hypothetical protein
MGLELAASSQNFHKHFEPKAFLASVFLPELQTKRTERKRRTTANPHFACGNYDSEVGMANR